VAGTVFTFGYSVRGDPDTVAFAGNPGAAPGTHVRSYDNDGRQNLWLVTFPGETYHNITMTYDARGKRLAESDAVGPTATTIQYSGLGQVLGDNTSYPGAGGSDGGGIETFTTNAFNDLLGATTVHVIANPAIQPVVQGMSYTFAPYTDYLTQAADSVNQSTDLWYYDASGNTQFSTMSVESTSGMMRDRATFYAADEKLAESDFRTIYSPGARSSVGPYDRVDEFYRYDALGRRVLVQANLECGNQSNLGGAGQSCEDSLVRRTIWDGQQELAEIQSPAADPERDTGIDTLAYTPVNEPALSNNQDDNAFFGQVLYTNGPDLDQPLSVVRLNYMDRHDSLGNALAPFLRPPLDIFLLWDTYGHFENFTGYCSTYELVHRCIGAYFTYGFLQSYNNVLGAQWVSWIGTLPQEKTDQSQTQYRRARSYDPQTGRFTQEDPIGLAGGINAYGFAHGDPVNYADPFGLAPCVQLGNCTQSDGGVADVSGAAVAGHALVQGLRNFGSGVMCDAAPKTCADHAGAAYDAGRDLAGALRFWGDVGSLSDHGALDPQPDASTFTTIQRQAPGADGAVSEMMIERDASGAAISKTHRVTDPSTGTIIHQHQEHIGASGATRSFPEAWRQFPSIP
jgi:RHS repeat-associated protein